MPADKGKVKAALDAKFKGKSVSKELKEAYATRGADLIETDEDIQTWVDNMEGFIMDAAKEADRRATSATQKAKQEAADAVTGKQQDEPDPTPNDDLPADTPAWAKALINQNKALADKVNGLEQARTTETLETQMRNHPSLAGYYEKLGAGVFKGRVPQKPEELEDAVEAMKADFGPIVEKLGGPVIGNETPAGGTPKGGSANGVKPASPEMVQEALKNI